MTYVWFTFLGLDYPLCRRISPTDYFNIEVEAGRDPQSVIDDLNGQDANEDRPYRDLLGGWFSLGNIREASSKLVFRTDVPTSVDFFFTNIILHGSILFPKDSNVVWYFQISNSSATDCRGCLLSPTTTGENPLTANGSVQIADLARYEQVAGLYYYQLVVSTNCATEKKEDYCGNIVSYQVGRNKTMAPTVRPTPAPVTKPCCSFGTPHPKVSD